ncbi:GAF domain-containing protein [Psychromonas sp. MME1]|uniref:GAF domain-containing protein n=1 Tax=Psychromonas sp. MME1 TaxID=3231032 RepID=UPI0034E2C5E2
MILYNQGGAFKQTLTTKATQALGKHIRDNNINFTDTAIYQSYHDMEVIGSYTVIDIGDYLIGLVVEVNETEATATLNGMQQTLLLIIVMVVIASFIAAAVIISRILSPIHSLNSTFTDIATGEIDVDFRLDIKTDDEIGHLANSFNKFMAKLKLMIEEFDFQNRVETAKNTLNEIIRDKDDYALLTKETLSYLCKLLNMQMGAIYLRDGNELSLSATYAYSNRKSVINKVHSGEGLVGQCLLEKEAFIINDTPDDYITIQSGLGGSKPKNIAVIPCLYENEVLAIIEFASVKEITSDHLALINILATSLANAVNSTKMRSEMRILLEKTTLQTEEMTVQQEESE